MKRIERKSIERRPAKQQPATGIKIISEYDKFNNRALVFQSICSDVLFRFIDTMIEFGWPHMR